MSNELRSLRYRFACIVVCVLVTGTARAQQDTAGYNVHTASSFDEKLFLQINHWGTDQTPGLDHAMIFASASAAEVIIATPLALYGYGLWQHDGHAAFAGMSSALSVGISALLTEGVKEIVRRPRPYHEIIGTRTPSALSGGYSFPSGHSTGAFALATSLSLYYPKWYVIAPSFAWASYVAISRPYLGVHYPMDILVGALIGSGTAILVYHFDRDWGDALRKLLPNGMIPTYSMNNLADPSHIEWAISVPIR